MGDRANIFVADDAYESGTPVGVYLYSHWGGAEVPVVLKRVLARRKRWDDPAYLARIIFCEMVRGDERGETNFGISARMGDNEHAIVAVDCHSQRVSFCTPDAFVVDGIGPSAFASWPFEAYVVLSDDEIIDAFAEGDEESTFE